MVCNYCCCGWCRLSALCPDRLCPEVWYCGRLVPWHVGWQSDSQQSQPAHWRVSEWLGHKFSKELFLMAVCMDDMAT